jgi:hypothetical protein
MLGFFNNLSQALKKPGFFLLNRKIILTVICCKKNKRLVKRNLLRQVILKIYELALSLSGNFQSIFYLCLKELEKQKLERLSDIFSFHVCKKALKK